jgi:hypothetical protein
MDKSWINPGAWGAAFGRFITMIVGLSGRRQ